MAAGKRFQAFAVLVVSSLAAGAAMSQELCLYGCPTGAPATNRTVSRTIYVLSNNGTTKFADWAAYRITRDTIGAAGWRGYGKDPGLPIAETLTTLDYRLAWEVLKVDHGHQVPLASFTGTPDWKLTNLLSNIAPRAVALNRGSWERLASAERNLAQRSGVSAVYSVTGPLYEREMARLPHAAKDHKVPSGYWKIIAVERNGELRAQAFIMPQETPRDADFCRSAVMLSEVERRSRLTFFPQLEKTWRDRIDAQAGSLSAELGCPAAGPEAAGVPDDRTAS